MRWMRRVEARNRRVKRSIHAEAFFRKSHTRPLDDMGLAIIAVIVDQKAATGTEVANEMSLLALTVTLSSLVLNTRSLGRHAALGDLGSS